MKSAADEKSDSVCLERKISCSINLPRVRGDPESGEEQVLKRSRF